ncbi:leucine-rich repeat domain-containing protein, partial [Capnocytophaga granulosa]|uniref:leucine-rich repeat domain-containing protein n=1 Tax=Capnocytophaga granulosa TaxID=45242 RepID=UPI003C73F69C
FRNMQTLDIPNTNLEELAVKSFPKLTRISIVNGYLNKVTITDASELKELSLERNSLTALPATFFDGLTKLTAINLMGNDIVGELNLTSIKGLESNAGKVQIMRVCGTCNPKDRTNKRITKIYVKDEAVDPLNNAEGASVYVSISGGRPQDNTVVNVPDENLRRLIFRKLKAIGGNTYLNRTYKDDFTQSDVDKITDLIGEFYSIGSNVKDLTGLERFTKLKKLELFPQGPTTLDLTAMQELEEITLGGTIATITGEGTSLEKITIQENYNVKKLDLRGFVNLKRIIISENSQAPNHIECIAVPENKVEIIKAGITFSAGGGNADSAAQKQALYRDKVQSTPCN